MERTLQFNTVREAQQFAKSNNGKADGTRVNYDDEKLPGAVPGQALADALRSATPEQVRAALAALAAGDVKPAENQQPA
jgi:hypothetical protein